MLHQLLRTWFEWVEAWGYLGVFLLMAMESSIIPVPSEIVMPPAAYWASLGRMSFAGVIAAGSLGSLFGSLVSYYAGKWLGQPFLKKYAKLILISPEKLALAENWVKRYGALGIFLARLLPVIRHLISIPAGAFRFPVMRFQLVTLGGATLWCIVLAWFGAETLGQQPELLTSPEALVHAVKAKLLWFVIAVVIMTALYGVVFFRKKPAASAAQTG